MPQSFANSLLPSKMRWILLKLQRSGKSKYLSGSSMVLTTCRIDRWLSRTFWLIWMDFVKPSPKIRTTKGLAPTTIELWCSTSSSGGCIARMSPTIADGLHLHAWMEWSNCREKKNHHTSHRICGQRTSTLFSWSTARLNEIAVIMRWLMICLQDLMRYLARG